MKAHCISQTQSAIGKNTRSIIQPDLVWMTIGYIRKNVIMITIIHISIQVPITIQITKNDIRAGRTSKTLTTVSKSAGTVVQPNLVGLIIATA